MLGVGLFNKGNVGELNRKLVDVQIDTCDDDPYWLIGARK